MWVLRMYAIGGLRAFGHSAWQLTHQQKSWRDYHKPPVAVQLASMYSCCLHHFLIEHHPLLLLMPLCTKHCLLTAASAFSNALQGWCCACLGPWIWTLLTSWMLISLILAAAAAAVTRLQPLLQGWLLLQ
jgi:hypothetical protein